MTAYCDHNAGSPLRPEARDALVRALAPGGNPSSVHRYGRAAHARVEDAREALAAAVNARAENVVFTSGATEALHLVLDSARGGARSFLYSAIEHEAVATHAPHAWPGARSIPATAAGMVDLAALERALAAAAKPALVAIMHANNETGVIQPIGEVARRVREAGGLLLVDAAQSFGKIPVDVAALDATYLVVSSHKIGGPQGAGALILAPGAPFQSTRRGGGQEQGRRPGTENAPAIAGFGAAAQAASRASADASELRDAFERDLRARWPGIDIVGHGEPRLPNTSLFVLPHMKAETTVIALDLAGVCVSAGAACSSGKVRASRVLEAMSAPPHWRTNAVRASFGWNSTRADGEALLAALTPLMARAPELTP